MQILRHENGKNVEILNTLAPPKVTAEKLAEFVKKKAKLSSVWNGLTKFAIEQRASNKNVKPNRILNFCREENRRKNLSVRFSGIAENRL